MVTQLCKLTKSHGIAYEEGVNFIVCKLCLNETVKNDIAINIFK